MKSFKARIIGELVVAIVAWIVIGAAIGLTVYTIFYVAVTLR